MIKTLRSQSLRAVLPRIICAVLLCAILLAVTGFGAFKLLAGPKPVSESSRPGDYVSFDLSQVIVGYATASVSGSVVRTYYILDLGNGKLGSLCVPKGEEGLLSAALRQSEAYYNDGTLDTLARMGQAEGHVSALDSSYYDLMVEGLDTVSLEGEPVPVEVTWQRVGTMGKTWTLILSAAALALLLLAAAQLIAVLSGAYQKKALAAAQAVLPLTEAEEDFKNAQRFDQTYLGDRLIWYQLGAASRCVPTEGVVWGFDRLDSRVLGTRRYTLYLYDRDGNAHDIRTKTEQERPLLAKAVEEKGHPFVYGYSQDRAHRFAADRAGFIRDIGKE